jgi:hypothetical protein
VQLVKLINKNSKEKWAKIPQIKITTFAIAMISSATAGSIMTQSMMVINLLEFRRKVEKKENNCNNNN